MKLSIITALVAAPLLALGGTTAMAAPAQHDVYLETYDAYEAFPAEENPCGTWPGTFHEVRDGAAKLLVPSGQANGGELHINMVVYGLVELIPDDPALPTYSGTYREKADGIVSGWEGSETDRVVQYRLRIALSGTDGSSLTLVLSGKVTVNGQDRLVVDRMRFSCD
jgi:hypothetical protein